MTGPVRGGTSLGRYARDATSATTSAPNATPRALDPVTISIPRQSPSIPPPDLVIVATPSARVPSPPISSFPSSRVRFPRRSGHYFCWGGA